MEKNFNIIALTEIVEESHVPLQKLNLAIATVWSLLPRVDSWSADVSGRHNFAVGLAGRAVALATI
jgi:hypothetical protein